jgi:outer membrane protein
MMIKQNLQLALLLLTSLLFAQEKEAPYGFSLQEAIDYAVLNNKKAINSGQDILAAQQKKWETTAAGLPQITGNLSYQNNFNLPVSVIPAEAFGGQPGTFNAVTFGVKQNATAALSLTQLLFDGSYIVALQASKTYLQYYKNYKSKTDLDVKEQVISAYSNVLLAQENEQIIQKNIASLQKTLFETEQTYKNGLIEEENVEQLQITLASLKNNLNYIQRLQNISMDMLKIAVGLPLEKKILLKDNLESLTLKKADLEATLSDVNNVFDYANNIDYQIAQNYVTQRSLEFKSERAMYLPTLATSLNFGYNAFSNNFTFFNSDQRYYNYSNLGINLSVPIFSSFKQRARVQQAKIALAQANNDLTNSLENLKLAYENALSNYQYSIETYTNTKESLALAERIERKQQIKFKEGLSSSFEFSEAQRQLYTSQQSYLQSMADIVNKKAALDKITNKL